jgi:hypothetical protein
MEIWWNFDDFIDIYRYNMRIQRSFKVLWLLSWKYGGFKSVIRF